MSKIPAPGQEEAGPVTGGLPDPLTAPTRGLAMPIMTQVEALFDAAAAIDTFRDLLTSEASRILANPPSAEGSRVLFELLSLRREAMATAEELRGCAEGIIEAQLGGEIL